MDTTTSTTPRILADLTFLDALVRQIGPERVSSVSTTGALTIHLVDDEDGHAIAADLGLTEPRTYGGTHWYDGTVDGHLVRVFATAPQYVVVDADTEETLTGPMSHYDATAVVTATPTATRRLHVQAVTR